jgi:hypothetical protein
MGLKQWYQRWLGRPRPGRDCWSQRRRLTLEALEDRTLPSVTIWTGANTLADFNWSDPANWSNGVPGPSDMAEFNSDSAATQFSIVDTRFSIKGLLITTGLAGGSISVNAPLVLTVSSEWDSGSIIVNRSTGGTVANDGTMTLNLSGNSVALSGDGAFTNNGTISVEGTGLGGSALQLHSGTSGTTTLNNTSTGVIDFQSDSGIVACCGATLLTNAGTIAKTGGTNTSSIDLPLDNTGTIDAESGTIAMGPGLGAHTTDTNGTFKTAAGAFIDLAPFADISFTENGTFTATGSGSILLEAGTLAIAPTGATFNIPGTDSFLWSNGAAIDIPTMTTLTYNGPLSLNGSSAVVLEGGGTFLENGTITESGAGGLYINDGSSTSTTLDIASGSTFDFQSDAGIGNSCCGEGRELLTNAGTIEKTGGNGTSTISAPIINSGTIGVYAGTLNLAPPSRSLTSSGSLVVQAGSAMQVAGDYTQTSAGSLQPILASPGQFGALQVAGQATLAGALNVSTANNFSPTNGQSFPVLTAGSVSGTFAALSGLSFANGISLSPVYSPTTVVLLASVSPPLLAAAGRDVSAIAGQPFSGVVATITDAILGITAQSLQATITWGDGHTSAGTVSANGDGAFNVRGTNTYAQAGSYAVSVVVQDTANHQLATAQGTATVLGSPLPLSTLRGITMQLVTVKVGKKKRRLVIEVFFADTGAKKGEFTSPFQKPGFKNIQVSVRDSNGDGVPDQIVVTARKGKKTVTTSFPG